MKSAKLLVLAFFLVPSLGFAKGDKSDKGKAEKVNYSEDPVVAQLNDRLKNPKYRVLFLGRHGRASQKNKFSSSERELDPKKVELDLKRPLEQRGKDGAKELARLMSHLDIGITGMWGSNAKRVKDTAEKTAQVIRKKGHLYLEDFSNNFYYVDVPAVMRERLLDTEEGRFLIHAFFWGHGRTTLELFMKLTGIKKAFLPTAGIMVVAIKADSWKEVFDENTVKHVEAYAWSPRQTHETLGDLEVHTIPSIVGEVEPRPSRLE